MKKLVYIVFFVSFVVTTACSKIDYQINEAYETAEITGITLYAVSDKPVNVVESFEIDIENALVQAFVPQGTDLTQLRLVLTISTGATVTPSVNGFIDLSVPKEYTVTSPNGLVKKDWTIDVDVVQSE
ncbi:MULTISPECIES: hypothetical protein [Bacteroides]|jgi:hypothetical protein|uniref:DUF1735 domain-containing protein n=1 Tax=Bacteroides nordii CL02T12C05 TaxID=997884 RepID=I9RNZ8_9BACE|nr:hypothetical protein [Bacteroides nordii]EIY44666.1 hypothetical protein HMPREF1068_03953 [Bacteroides nordii CL02T12C05]MCE8465264.1 hypothetical protein [Bacteroides nordii]UYU50927.1 hypothetical protein KQP55_10140 [Bacteroides nordii]GFZ38455.1 hypothetical protein BANORC5_04900 [Bacteroides nordii]